MCVVYTAARLRVMKPSTCSDLPLTSENIIFISITHNYIMPGRRCSLKSFLTFLAGVVILLFSVNLLREIHQMAGFETGPHSAGSARFAQKLQSRHFGQGLEIAEPPPPREWDTTVLSSSVSVRPPCSTSAMLLILITSAPANFHMRAAIRETWCAKSSKEVPLHIPGNRLHTAGGSNGTASYLCIFLIGRSGKAKVDSQVKEEIDIYDDILYGEYTDTYRNLTFKVLTGFLWGSVNCGANFVLKTDDDCFVNVDTFLKFLSLQEMTTGVYVGRIFKSQSQTRVIRDHHSKWSVSPDLYAPEYYPPYASGTGYLLSSDVMHRIIKYSQHYTPFPNEDAYIGVLAEQLHIAPIHSGRFVLVSTQWGMCNFKYLLVLHKVDSASQRELQTLANQAVEQCHSRTFPTHWG